MPTPQSKSAPDFIPAGPDFIPSGGGSAPTQVNPTQPEDKGVLAGGIERVKEMAPKAPSSVWDYTKLAAGAAPLETIYNAGKSYLSGIKPGLESAGKQVQQGMNEAYNLHDPNTGSMDAFRGATRGLSALVPFAGGVGNMQDLQDAGKPDEATGAGLADLGAMAVGEGAGRVVPPIARNLNERFGGYTSPVIPDTLQHASNLAKTIHPQGGIPTGFEEDLESEIPHVKAYAQETGNPFHSQWEASRASKELAEQGLNHFNTNVLGPNAEAQIPVGRSNPFQGFNGPSTGTPQTMSLGDINGRITAINKLLKPAQNAMSESKQMTAVERSGLEDERRFLTGKLYNELSQRTGIPPEDIKGMRESYGKQFDIADAMDTARRARNNQVGIAAEGGNPLPTSKTGFIDKALTGMRGGRDYIANSNFRKAVSPFEATPIEYPQPQYPQQLQGDQYNNPFINKARSR